MGPGPEAPRRALAAGLYAGVVTGGFYGFGVYAKALKARFALSQYAIASVNTLPYCLGLISPLTGAVMQRIGLRGALLAGGVLIVLSQTTMYCVGTIDEWRDAVQPHAPYVLVAISSVTYLGFQYVTCVAFPVVVRHFPQTRVMATACGKSFVGVGGAVVAQVFRVLYGTPTADVEALRCLLLWAGVTLACTVFGVVVMPTRLPAMCHSLGGEPELCAEPRSALRILFGEVGVLGVFATVAPFAANGAVHDALVAVMIVLALLPVPICLFAAQRRAPVERVEAGTSLEPSALQSRQGATRVQLLRAGSTEVEVRAGERCQGGRCLAPPPTGADPSLCAHASLPGAAVPAALREDVHYDDLLPPDTLATAPSRQPSRRSIESEKQSTICQMLSTPDAWLLWFNGVVLTGGGGLIATQLAFILEAASAPDAMLTTCVTTFGTGNLLGRLLTPVASDAFLVKRGRARPWVLVVVSLLMGVAQLAFLAAAAPGVVAAGGGEQSALVAIASGSGGLAFGAIWPMLVVLTSELFGSTHLSLNYMFYDGVCAACGTVLLGNLLPSYVYHLHGAPRAGGVQCAGPRCFALTHEVIAGLCVASCAAAVVLATRWKGLYRHRDAPGG